MTPQELLDFEQDIYNEFAAGKIKSPIHLAGGNEEQLIKIFACIFPDDWVLAGWRSHYHCLLKGVPPAELKAAIMAGQSVSLTFPQQKVLCSGIMGGNAPIALGIAKALKEAGSKAYVYCFLGDMTAECGIVHECIKYATRHYLPVTWIIEDNGLSVCTDTQASWGLSVTGNKNPDVSRYHYTLSRPHSGIGQWVRF